MAFSRPRTLISRAYSNEEKQSSEAGATPQNESAPGSVEDDSSAQSSEQKIIAAKDAEILDLTVRLLSSGMRHTTANSRLFE